MKTSLLNSIYWREDKIKSAIPLVVEQDTKSPVDDAVRDYIPAVTVSIVHSKRYCTFGTFNAMHSDPGLMFNVHVRTVRAPVQYTTHSVSLCIRSPHSMVHTIASCFTTRRQCSSACRLVSYNHTIH